MMLAALLIVGCGVQYLQRPARERGGSPNDTSCCSAEHDRCTRAKEACEEEGPKTVMVLLRGDEQRVVCMG